MLALSAYEFQLTPVFQFSPQLFLSHSREFIMPSLTPVPVAGIGVSPCPVLRQEPFDLLGSIGAVWRLQRRHNSMLRTSNGPRFARALTRRGYQDMRIR